MLSDKVNVELYIMLNTSLNIHFLQSNHHSPALPARAEIAPLLRFLGEIISHKKITTPLRLWIPAQ